VPDAIEVVGEDGILLAGLLVVAFCPGIMILVLRWIPVS
jgi:hypothetical protein